MSAFIEGLLLGNAAIITNVCLLPLYPGMIAFMAGQQGQPKDNEAARWRSGLLGVVVLAGVFTMLLLIGVLFTGLRVLYAPLLPVLVIASYLLVIALGGLMLAGRNPFARLNTVQAPVLQNRTATAYVYGLLLAPMTLPCTGALLLGALGRVVGLESLSSELAYLMGFCLGFGWPLVLLPLVAVPAQRRFIGWMTRNHTLIERVAGALLVAVGLYGLTVDVMVFSGTLAL
jgi:cytochrome c-type biogenesis protein